MTLRNARPVRWSPRTLSDTTDSTTGVEGAMGNLANLIPSQNSGGIWVCRPAATRQTTFPGVTSPGEVTNLITVGDIAYGMLSSNDFAGKDRPFVYNLVTGVIVAISGMTSGNLPTTQPTTGDWTPPTAAAIGSRIVFTHPGFAGGTTPTPFFNQFFANTANGSATLSGITPNVFPFLQIGQQIFGSGIPANTTITNISLPSVTTTASGTSGTNTITVASATGIAIGQTANNAGIPGFTTVTNIVGTTVTLSANLITTLTSSPVTFVGSVATMSQNASATASMVTISSVSATSTKFGWLDISGFTLGTQANTIAGLPVLTGNPTIAGVQPGMTIAGPGIPVGTVVQQIIPVVVVITGSVTALSGQIVFVTTPGNGSVQIGMTVAGAGIPLGAQVQIITNSTTIQMNVNATASNSSESVTFSGAIIILSQNATATATGVSVTITGGTAAAPLWGAGDTNINSLANIPVFVSQFSGRAYFGVNTTSPVTSAVAASDPSIACQISNTNQVITFADGIPVTAANGLPLANQLGGVIQSLMVFQGAANIRQITGDFAFGNLAQNSLQVATGTLAPNSIASTPQGLLFVAPDGVRLIDFDARVSDPIGARGEGPQIPFINTVSSSRTSASYNENVYRVSITWTNQSVNSTLFGVAPGATARQQFWYHLDIKGWSGPHTFPFDQIAPWQSRNTFISAPAGGGGLWRADAINTPSSNYVENGVALTWSFGTALLPDNPDQMACHLVESSVFLSIPAATQALASAIDDQGQTLDQTYVWLGPNVTRAQLPIYWINSVVFRQVSIFLTGPSSATVSIGTLNLRYQQLRYPFTSRPAAEFVVGQSVLGGPDVLGP